MTVSEGTSSRFAKAATNSITSLTRLQVAMTRVQSGYPFTHFGVKRQPGSREVGLPESLLDSINVVDIFENHGWKSRGHIQLNASAG